MLAYECYMQPRVVEKLMRSCLISTNKYQNKLWSKITLDRLKKHGVGTNDVQSFAFSQLKINKSKKYFSEYGHCNLVIKYQHALKGC